MKRVYRLLRNNRESGPYTIDELLGQNLRPDDMLWIEGRSTAWCFLSEIELFPVTEPDASSKQFAGGKKDDIESRANEIRKKVMNYKQQPLPVREERGEHGEMHYYVPVTPLDTIEIVDHRKPKSTMVNDVLMTLLIVGLFAGGLYGGRSLYLPKKQDQSTVIQSISKDEHAAKKSNPVVNEPVVVAPTAIDSTSLAALNKPKPSKRPGDSTRLSRRITKITINNAETPPAITEQANAQANTDNEGDATKTEVELVKEVKPVSISSDEIEKNDAPEKKQNVFRKIFGKKKKNDKDAN